MPYEFNISLSQVLRNCFFFFNFPLIGKRHNDTRFPTIEVSSYSLEHTINRSDGWLGTIIHFHNIFFSPISESSFGFSSAFILQPYFCLNFAHLFIRKCLTISQYTQHTTRFTKNKQTFWKFQKWMPSTYDILFLSPPISHLPNISTTMHWQNVLFIK